MIRRRDLIVPLVAGAGYTALGLFWLRFVYLSDFFQMIWLADAQRAGIGSAWANGFLGFGYPALLNLVTIATGNILTSGKLIQIISGVAVLLMLPWATRTPLGTTRARSSPRPCWPWRRFRLRGRRRDTGPAGDSADVSRPRAGGRCGPTGLVAIGRRCRRAPRARLSRALSRAAARLRAGRSPWCVARGTRPVGLVARRRFRGRGVAADGAERVDSGCAALQSPHQEHRDRLLRHDVGLCPAHRAVDVVDDRLHRPDRRGQAVSRARRPLFHG